METGGGIALSRCVTITLRVNSRGRVGPFSDDADVPSIHNPVGARTMNPPVWPGWFQSNQASAGEDQVSA
jgi:hypothetical protein